jgi:hypothetical protein
VPRSSAPRPALVLLGVLAFVLAGCRFGVTGELTIDRDGTATAEVVLAVDAAALAELDALGVDPTAELAAAAGRVPAWQVTREVLEEGGLVVRLSRPTADAEAAADAFRELSAGLAEADPALLIDLDVHVDAEGAVRVDGTATFRAPATPGATLDGEPAGPGPDELDSLTAQAVDASFRLTVPGELLEHDADTVEGRTASWELAVGRSRAVTAVAAAPTGVPTELLLVGLVVVALVALSGLVWSWHRRRREG